MNLWSLAKTFREAGHVLLEADPLAKLDAGDAPTYYIICHALELSIKAFLRARGFNDCRLRALGHDLRRCLKKAGANELSRFVKLDADETGAIRLIGRLYQMKELEYVVSGAVKSLPRISLLVSALDKIIPGIRNECLQATVRERESRKVAV